MLGKINTDDAFVMGHSFGGATALLAASKDHRFKVKSNTSFERTILFVIFLLKRGGNVRIELAGFRVKNNYGQQ